MGLFKRNPFGHILILKKWLIRIFGALTHRRFRGFNELQIEGSEIIKDLPDTNVLFISSWYPSKAPNSCPFLSPSWAIFLKIASLLRI